MAGGAIVSRMLASVSGLIFPIYVSVKLRRGDLFMQGWLYTLRWCDILVIPRHTCTHTHMQTGVKANTLDVAVVSHSSTGCARLRLIGKSIRRGVWTNCEHSNKRTCDVRACDVQIFGRKITISREGGGPGQCVYSGGSTIRRIASENKDALCGCVCAPRQR